MERPVDSEHPLTEKDVGKICRCRNGKETTALEPEMLSAFCGFPFGAFVADDDHGRLGKQFRASGRYFSETCESEWDIIAVLDPVETNRERLDEIAAKRPARERFEAAFADTAETDPNYPAPSQPAPATTDTRKLAEEIVDTWEAMEEEAGRMGQNTQDAGVEAEWMYRQVEAILQRHRDAEVERLREEECERLNASLQSAVQDRQISVTEDHLKVVSLLELQCQSLESQLTAERAKVERLVECLTKWDEWHSKLPIFPFNVHGKTAEQFVRRQEEVASFMDSYNKWREEYPDTLKEIGEEQS